MFDHMLKPCPVCGGSAHSGIKYHNEREIKAFVSCDDGCTEQCMYLYTGPKYGPYVSFDACLQLFNSVVKKWNEAAEKNNTRDPQQKTAEWILDRRNHWYCSNCQTMQGITARFMKYCPKCGRKMTNHMDLVNELKGQKGEEI